MPYVGDLQPSSNFFFRPAYARLRVCLTRFADLLPVTQSSGPLMDTGGVADAPASPVDDKLRSTS